MTDESNEKINEDVQNNNIDFNTSNNNTVSNDKPNEANIPEESMNSNNYNSTHGTDSEINNYTSNNFDNHSEPSNVNDNNIRSNIASDANNVDSTSSGLSDAKKDDDSNLSESSDVNQNVVSLDSNADTKQNVSGNYNNWQSQSTSNQYNGSNNPNINNSKLNTSNLNSYYKENYKKTHKNVDTWKYVVVSLISAIVGASILAVMLLVVAPVVQPKLKSFFGMPTQESTGIGAQTGSSEVKKVEIVQTGESAVTSVAEKVGPSVVGIRTSYQSTNELFGSQSDYGEGSGIIISSDGYILTNHHVVENALNDKTRTIKTGSHIQVYLSSRIDKPYKAEIKGYDSKTDLAVLKISENNLPAIEFGNSEKLKVGEPAIAFGNPGGLEYMGSLTTGVISGLNRTVQLDGGKKIRLIQTDAAINPGNSGGALVNIKGQLIGVNTIKMVATGFEGLGFAIPVNDAKKIADELIQNTYISKPYLGIYVDNSYTEEIAKANKMPMGVFVADVEILGAAQKAGIKALDIITKFNNVTVKSYDQLEEEKNKFKPGDVVDVEIYRDGSRKTLKVTLGETK